jgi:hypothetical protein
MKKNKSNRIAKHSINLSAESADHNSVAAPQRPNPAAKRKPSRRFRLRRGLGFWTLTFEGANVILKHEQGLAYVAYLLTNPPEEPIHGLALALRVNERYGASEGITELADPLNGKLVAVPREARMQEQGLRIEEAEVEGALRRKQLELEALLDDPDTFEPIRAEVTRELEAIYAFQKRNPGRTTDAAQKAVRAVRMAIRRFHTHLLSSVDGSKKPNRILHRFAAHLDKYLLTPSARYASRKASVARTGLAGSFTYEPPTGVRWAQE